MCVLITVVLIMSPDDLDIPWTIAAYCNRKRSLDKFIPESRNNINTYKLWWKYYTKSKIKSASYIEEMNELNDIECKNIVSKYNFWTTKTINPSAIEESSNALVIDVSFCYNEIDMFEARFYELNEELICLQ